MFSSTDRLYTVLCLALLSVEVRPWSEECALESKRNRIKQCFKRLQVADLHTFECFEVNSKGGCEKGNRMVVDENSECKASKCIENKDKNGEPCPEEQLAYNGVCELSNSKSACKNTGLGKRLQADLFGKVSCRCALDLGFVDVDGTCYHEFQQGPCKVGQQIIRNGFQGWKCMNTTSTCGPGRIRWSDGRCYQVEQSEGMCDGRYELYEVTTGKYPMKPVQVKENEQVEDLFNVKCTSACVNSVGTFNPCAAVAETTGECLSKRKSPQQEQEDNLRALFCNLIPDEC
eukprot:GFUD01014930.1.p1 GENE.GFUD01014930.1~~GFUD01014930.1.p1  ORF type:complete len:288 (+),score=60.04 GFUD01014930.1:87-950(+)